jgi:hypothetical protein
MTTGIPSFWYPKTGIPVCAENYLERLSRIQASPSVSEGQANRCRGNFSFGMFHWAEYWCSVSHAVICSAAPW